MTVLKMVFDRTLKRATREEPIFLDAQLYPDLEALTKKIVWKYKAKITPDLVVRDQALFSFLLLTGLRISEALQVKRKQLRIYPGRIEAANIRTAKRGLTRTKIILPKKGSLKGLTLIFEEWLLKIEDQDAYIFPTAAGSKFNFKKPLDRTRAYRIVALTGKFPHWARAVCETIYGRKVFKNDAWKLKEFMGLKRLDSTAAYVSGSWEDNEKDVYKL
jgi:integrase